MDTGDGNFAMFKEREALEKAMQDTPNHGGVFRVGQKVEINGSDFRVARITRKGLVLRLLPK